MKKYLLIILSIGLFVFASCQKAGGDVSKLYGSWRLTSVTDENGKTTENADMVLTFAQGNYGTESIGELRIGEWGASGQDVGTFYYDADKGLLTFDIFEASGVYEIKKLTNKQLVLYARNYKETATFSKL